MQIKSPMDLAQVTLKCKNPAGVAVADQHDITQQASAAEFGAMKKCELCDSSANMVCKSDQASLCWSCDSMVHGANFLVAKHVRILLCHVCHAPTPWNASGPKLVPIVSLCISCDQNRPTKESDGHEVGYDGGCDDHGLENQVVPCLSLAHLPNV